MTAHNAKPMPAGTRFGRLVIIREADAIVDKKGGRRRAFTCKCDCGNEKVVKATDFTRWKVKTCGKLECKRKARDVLTLPEEQESFPPYTGERVSALEQRIKPRYFCKAVTPECTISTLLHICCCECDRPCKRCEKESERLKEVEEHGTSRKIDQGC